MVTQFYPPVAGGAEQYVRNLSLALAERGHEVGVATIGLGDDPPRGSDGNVAVYRLHTSAQRLDALFTSSRQFAPPLPDPEAVAGLRRIIREHRPDVIHAHDWLARSLLPRAARGRKPLVMTLHDYSLVCAKKRLMYRHAPCSGPGPLKCLTCATDHYGPWRGPPTAIANWVTGRSEQRAVGMFIPVSRAVADGNGLRRRRLPFRVIPNFVPDDLATTPGADDPALADLPSGDFLLYVGDLARDKGVTVLLDAYRALESPPPLVLIGRSHLPLDDLPPGVTALGVLPAAAVVTAWRRSLLGVVPSIVPDSCPTVVLEAMAAGRPVVGTRSGGIPDLIDDGATGILVPHSDPQALAGGLQRLLTSAELRTRMGEAGREKLKQFAASAVVPRIEQVYRDMLAA
jgi:glycosyltransferase involved in cell wall biosynthesis